MWSKSAWSANEDQYFLTSPRTHQVRKKCFGYSDFGSHPTSVTNFTQISDEWPQPVVDLTWNLPSPSGMKTGLPYVCSWKSPPHHIKINRCILLKKIHPDVLEAEGKAHNEWFFSPKCRRRVHSDFGGLQATNIDNIRYRREVITSHEPN